LADPQRLAWVVNVAARHAITPGRGGRIVRAGRAQDEDEAMIELRNVEKSYPQGAGSVWVLRRIDLKVDEGEFVSIMGPSGAGKSTLLHILGLHDGEFSGEYDLVGQRVHKLSRKERHELQKATIGFVFQSYHLLDELTVAENLELPLSYRNLRKPEREAIVADTLDRFQIVGKKDLYPSQLSGGQQQLVGVARAIVASPKLILADEPTGNLHSDQGREIMELFCRLNAEGTTIVQVTHSETNAAYGRRVVRLRDGWIVGQETRSGTAGSPVRAGGGPAPAGS
jgi:ABC-type lipoprotein export system ATPase subunit